MLLPNAIWPELLRFRAWALGYAALHLVVLGFMTRVVDLAQHPVMVYQAIGGAYGRGVVYEQGKMIGYADISPYYDKVDTLLGKVRNLNYRTMRYPGHAAIMKALLNDLGLRNRRALLKDILENAVPATLQDVVIVFVTVSGLKDGKLMPMAMNVGVRTMVSSFRGSLSNWMVTPGLSNCTAATCIRSPSSTQASSRPGSSRSARRR